MEIKNQASEVSIHTPNLVISPNQGNHIYVTTIKGKVLTFGIGPAGTGKTYFCFSCREICKWRSRKNTTCKTGSRSRREARFFAWRFISG